MYVTKRCSRHFIIDMEIRKLTAEDAIAFKEVRLRGLRDHPEAFGESAGEFEPEPPNRIADRYIDSADPGGTFALGAFTDDRLVGVVCLRRDRMRKRKHKAILWGMYVADDARRQGIGEQLVHRLLDLARAAGDLDHIMLTVASVNTPARRLYEQCGFRSIGTESKALRIDGVDYDQEHMVYELHGENS